MRARTITALQATVACLASLAPGVAHAYIGPGSGLATVGALLAVLAAVLLALVGFAWYPVKRLVGYVKNRRKKRAEGADDANAAGETVTTAEDSA